MLGETKIYFIIVHILQNFKHFIKHKTIHTALTISIVYK